jgi:hypothetical protein
VPVRKAPTALEQVASVSVKQWVVPITMVLAPAPALLLQTPLQQRRKAARLPVLRPLERSGVRLI